MRTPPAQSPLLARSERLAARRRNRRQIVLTAAAVAVIVGVAAAGAWSGGWRPSGALGSGSTSSQTKAIRSSDPLHATGTLDPIGGQTDASAPASVAPIPAAPATITISAVGDMIFDRRVKSLIETRGGLAPLAKVSRRLSASDVTLGNLESNLSSSGSPQPGKAVTFRGHPAAIEGLTASGFDFVALGNNHALDFGPSSLRDTLAALDAAGIGHSGAGSDRAAAWKPAVVERHGASVAFLSFSHVLPPGFIATDSRPGIARGRGNMAAVAKAISAAKKKHDYVIASFHWGVEYQDLANAEQVRDARRAIDAGADLVLSHHPHVIQGIEFYKKGLIAYSLGDFVFDHYSRKTGEAFVLDLSLGPAGVRNVVATPVYLDADGAPAVVKGSDASVILKRLATISAPHGTKTVIRDDIARLAP